jgi:inositol-phosphate phosphatase/L-galactose 1-phosphate phosphatase/histidinol-phosphatase
MTAGMTAEACPREFVDLAGRLADAAGPIVRGYFRAGTEIHDKADATPVTAADREAETAMRALIEAEFPGHGILGEEFGPVREDAEFVWVLDPIDGTKSFVTGKPLFGILIGLARAGLPILGIIEQPVLGERWIGAAGMRTTFNGRPAHTRSCGALGDAWLYATSPEMFGEGEDFAAFGRLKRAVKHPVYGADCYAYGLLAAGFVDLVCEAALKPFDFTAIVPIVAGAGGVMTDWAGADLTLASDGRVLAAGDGAIHAAALERLVTSG